MIDFLNSIDNELFLTLNSLFRCDFLDSFMKTFSGRFIWAPMYAVIILLLYRNFKPWKATIYAVGIILSIALADQICATIIRPLVARLRPSNPENPISTLVYIVDGYRGGSYGFPSCHAANSFALATFLSCIIARPRFVAFIFTWAVFNSLTRIYLGVHYPGDLIVGGLIGSLVAYLCFRLSALTVKLIRAARISPSQSGRITMPLPVAISHATFSVATSDLMIGVGAATVFYIACYAGLS